MNIEPLASAADRLFAGILHGLETQRLVPGQRLVEADLVAQFGVGRNVVRETLQRLAAEGIVSLQRHKGAVIRTLSLHDTLDVLDVAERMTGLLARSAVRGADQATARAALQASLTDLDQAGNDVVAASRARRAFYRALLDMSAHQELRRLFPAIQMPIVHAQYPLPQLAALRRDDYRQLAEAVLTGDADAAEQAAGEHVQHVRAAILAHAAQAEPQPTGW